MGDGDRVDAAAQEHPAVHVGHELTAHRIVKQFTITTNVGRPIESRVRGLAATDAASQ